MKVLVTGGAGYIGSHTCIELLASGHEVIVVDSLVNSQREALNRVEEISGQRCPFYQLDLRDKVGLEAIFQVHKIDAVIHFAALKAVGESVAKPLAYYHNNLLSTLVLCEVMVAHGVKNFVFSSSATVYGEPEKMPIREDAPLSATNPYGRTKLMIEQILTDLHHSDEAWNVALLRYFNPIGAHPSGRIGEMPNGIPNNLVPYLAQVAVGKLDKLRVFGDDYPTPDGTGVRDYIHVVDLAKGHVRALDRLTQNPGVEAFNLGTGQGYSVLDVIEAFEEASNRPIPYEIVARRPGDVPALYADASKARELLGWQAEKNIMDMCVDVWRWQSGNPNGYED